MKFERRDVATREEARFYLERWAKPTYTRSYPVAIFSFHGHSGCLELDNGDLELEEIGDLLEGQCKDRYIHFDSCKVLDVDIARVQEFRRQTGAHIVSGYRRNIDWIDAAAFTLHILDELADEWPMPSSLRKIMRKNPDAGERLGFRAVWGRGQLGFRD